MHGDVLTFADAEKAKALLEAINSYRSRINYQRDVRVLDELLGQCATAARMIVDAFEVELAEYAIEVYVEVEDHEVRNSYGDKLLWRVTGGHWCARYAIKAPRGSDDFTVYSMAWAQAAQSRAVRDLTNGAERYKVRVKHKHGGLTWQIEVAHE